jgi:hypothetical protein
MVPPCLAASFRPRWKGLEMSLSRVVVTTVRFEGRTKAEVARD